MERVVEKEGALVGGGGGNCSSGMDGSKAKMRRYPGRGNVYYSGGFGYILGGAFEQERAKKKKKNGGGGVGGRGF